MSESLRDTIASAVEQHEQAQTPDTAKAGEENATPAGLSEQPSQAKDSPTPAEAAQPAKPGRTAGRARDEHGRLLPGKADPAAKAPAAAPVPQAPPVAPALEPKKIARPSSWKKDHWESFDQIAATNPALAEYLVQRENEFAKGVSTYKQEWDRAKPFLDAYAPYAQDFQNWGIDPAKQFQTYVEIHKSLALGTPEQRLGTLLRIAQDYQIPLQSLFVQGQDGKVYFNPQVQPAQLPQQARQPAQQQQDPRAIVREALAEERAAAEVAEMERNTEKYPHYETVKGTMRGLLQAGLAQDLPSAYEQSIRLHPEIFEALQEQKRAEDEAKRKAEEAKRVAAARAAQVSPKSATPTTGVSSGKQGLRSTIESAFDERVGGRV